jgi:outer membrane protein assembly factor BamB
MKPYLTQGRKDAKIEKKREGGGLLSLRLGAFARVLVLLILFAGPASAGEWPGWRGPHGDGTADEASAPERWSTTENVRWKTPIPGKGHSSPIVCNNRVFVTTCLEKDQKRVLLCLDRRDGKVLWERVVLSSPLERKHRLNSFASATPAADGTHVYVSFLQYPDMVVACYDFDGRLVWQRSPGKFFSVHGFCSSPVLYKDTVILNGDQDAEAYIVALDKKTGQERWRADRPNRTRSYCTPLIVHAAGKDQLVLSGSKCVASYDPDTGKQWWIIDGPTEQFVASLVYLNDVLFMTAGFPTYHVMGIRPDGAGNVTPSHVLWHSTQAQDYVPSPIAYDKYLFLVNDNGMASCWEAATGKLQWRQRLGRHHSASPVRVGGRLYFVDDDGQTFVLQAGKQFRLLAKNALGDECYASPAVAHGQLYIRTLHDLYCIGTAAKGGAD